MERWMPGLYSLYWDHDLIQFSIIMFLVLIAVCFCVERYYRIRIMEIDSANALTEQHIVALNKLLKSDDASPQVKSLLVSIESLMANRGHATSLIKNLFNRNQGEPSKEAKILIDDLTRISKSNPCFEANLKSFLETGIFAMTLRWPETRGKYVEVTVIVEKEQAADITRAVARTAEQVPLIPPEMAAAH
jgi:hypothetical protein